MRLILALLTILLPSVAWVSVFAQSSSPTNAQLQQYDEDSVARGLDYANRQLAFYVGEGAGGGGTSTATNRSGTITLGGQSQILFPANSHRVGCEVQMLGGDVWLSIGSDATAGSGSFLITAGSEFICPSSTPTVVINIFGPVTGVAFTAMEYTR
jgi:hypothetical protein